MEIDFKTLIEKYNIKVKGIIQLGAHYFQEKEMYQEMGINDFILIEPQSHAFDVLKTKTLGINAQLFRCAVSDYEGNSGMICDNNNHGQSGSLLEPKEHLNKYPHIPFNRREEVQVKRLENIPFNREKYNVLVMDLQGNELKALDGSGDLLEYIDCIFTEVNIIEMYKGCALLEQMDEWLMGAGFGRVETGSNISQGWTDALYIKFHA